MDGILMLLDAVYFNGKKLGFITDKGIEWGGNDAEFISLMAAQKRNAPVKKIKKKEATNTLKYRMFELQAENCKDIMGGKVTGEKWSAPSESVSLEGELKILTGSGYTIAIQRASLDGVIRGQIGGSDEPIGIDVTQEILAPLTGGAPFSIEPTPETLKVNPSSLSFVKAGETKTVDIEASGGILIGEAPTGFTVEFDGVRLKIKASANTGAARNGNLVISLAANPSKTVSIALSQAG